MGHLGMTFHGGHGGTGLMVGNYNFIGLFQPR